MIMRKALSGLQRRLPVFWAFLGMCICSHPVFAGSTNVTPPDVGGTGCTRIILLGTGGGPVARKLRSQPANLLVVDGRPYLIDAGDGVVRQLAWAGYQPVQIRTIFITHHHIDHDAGLEPLMSFIWFNAGVAGRLHPDVQVYGPPGTRDLIRAALEYLSVPERIFRSELTLPPAAPMFKAHDIAKAGRFYEDNEVRVTAAENTHYQFRPGSPSFGRDESFAYRFDTPHGSVVFTGDTGPSQAVESLARDADVLVSEVIDPPAVMRQMEAAGHLPPRLAQAATFHMEHEHLAPEEVGRLAAAAHVRLVMLTHFGPGADSETDMSRYTSGVARTFSGPVIAGRDLLEQDLCGVR
jgi:ribonuclease BN (tRNA processing enzyme)